MTVFIPNDAGHDYSVAKRYGDILFLTQGVVRKFDAQNLYREIARKMKESQADDYIMIGSLPILNGIAFGIQASRYGRVNMLLYRGGMYVERTIRVT